MTSKSETTRQKFDWSREEWVDVAPDDFSVWTRPRPVAPAESGRHVTPTAAEVVRLIDRATVETRQAAIARVKRSGIFALKDQTP